ncbi:uncharacterized protein LAESUDRAFT_762340 [Laetiporus sulphureus 93-53]|uniref:Uncharacterized protein n=1 Tax=Laetiporus sulphureus 93-53 TaxID=1314785 RepID=A0A165CJ80_9APHY|nr:uncharacterized protein LAESUDRAFT_762340 [Laetiporus sulphureus 93-53]KZT02908.1 hypothetical protein LAESUDRAFT_762340 [Laetiporus sulphureus 93-53]
MAFNLDNNSSWIELDAIYHQCHWPLPPATDKKVAIKVASFQLTYDRKQYKVNHEGAAFAKQLDLSQDTPVGKYEECLSRSLTFNWC